MYLRKYRSSIRPKSKANREKNKATILARIIGRVARAND